MRRQAKKFAKGSPSDGSALILTVVLTSLLAMVGVLFVMMARVNQIATSGISESRELDSAIETVIAEISEELALDIPRKDSNGVELSEYYDYPDVNNAWLASLEPYSDGGYKWRQISDVTGFLNDKGFSTQNVDVKPVGLSTTVYVRDYPEITLDGSGELKEQSADADGDGIADSKWVELADIASSKGRPIYAAIRIIDNGGMLNVNTAYKFNANETDKDLIDGSSQTQINLAALSERGANGSPAAAADKLQAERCGTEPPDLSLYEQNVVWRYDNPDGNYIPFDIGDELKLRNRYILNYNLMTSRIEELWENVYDVGPRTPLPTSAYPFSRWPNCTILGTIEPNDYDYRHISTIYNMDRIINPSGYKMLNINTVTVADINAVRSALTDYDPNFAEVNDVAAQITVNLIDFRDKDVNDNVTTITVDGTTYYGFERPCVYISELVHRFVTDANISVRPAGYVYRSYGIELHKPYYLEDDYPEPNQWRLSIEDYGTFPVNWSGTKYFHVMSFEHPDAPLDVNWDSELDPNLTLLKDLRVLPQPGTIVFTANKIISLERLVGSDWIAVDSVMVPFSQPGGWLEKDGEIHSYQRDITLHKCIRRLWDGSLSMEASETLGGRNAYTDTDPNVIQAHPANEDFTNVGEIGMVLRKGAYGTNGIGYNTDNDEEEEVRVDLAKPEFQQIFKYLTVFDPAVYPWNDPDEARIKGRININTAPWFVIAQLPWVSQREGGYNSNELARTIVGNRDIEGAFENIGQLMRVTDANADRSIDYYWGDKDDLSGFPDLTGGDGAEDDFEERDVIFARISNLVTVRSAVFTAYILVRIGTDGPQKRVIAILDRSDVYSPTNRVKIVAVHPVADPR